MEKLTVKEKFTYKKRALFLFLFCCTFILSVSAQSQGRSRKDSLIFKIDLQKGFKNDTVKLSINKQIVFKSTNVDSDAITDFTEISLEVFYLNSKKASVNYQKKTKRIAALSKEFFIEITLNRNSYKFDIDLSKGKFIGLIKKRDNTLELRQSERRFIYD